MHSARGPRSELAFCCIVRHANASVVEEQGEGRPAVEHVLDRLHEVVSARQLRRLLAHVDLEIVDQRPAFRRGAIAMRSSGLWPLIERSIINSASMRRTTSMAIGELGISLFPAALRRAFSSTSARTKNLRRACAEHAASWIGPGLRSAR